MDSIEEKYCDLKREEIIETLRVDLDNIQEERDRLIYLEDVRRYFKQKSPIESLGTFLFNGGIDQIIDAEIRNIEEIKKIKDSYSDVVPNDEIEMKTQFLFLNKLGVIDLLKKNYPILSDNDLACAKVLSQIMGITEVKKIDTIRTYVKELSDSPGNFINKTVNEKVELLMRTHKLE